MLPIARLKRTCAALEHKGFRLLWSAIFATSFGFYIQRTLELWLIYQLTGSALYLGLTGLVRGVPVVILSLGGGVLADRVDRRKFVMFVQSCNGVLNVMLAVLALTGLIDAWHIYFVAFMSSSLNAVGAPSRNAMVPGLVPRDMLMNALSLTSMSRKFSELLGPALTGVLIAVFSPGVTYAINGGVYFSAVLFVAVIQYASKAPRAAQSPFRSLVEGIAFIRHETVVGLFLGLDLIAVYFGSYRALLPIFVQDFGAGAEALGFLLSAAALGAILGVAVVLSLGNLRYKGLWVAFGIIVYSVCLVGLALSPWFLMSVVAVFLLGFSDAVQAVLRNVVIQTATPDNLRGRVSSFQRMLGVGGPSLGEAQSGFVAAVIGAPLTLVVAAVMCAGTTVGLLARRDEIRRAEF
jgi:MFS family permease